MVEHGAVQKVAELAAFVALLQDRRPETVVEIGSDAGGTLWAWQQIASTVIGVDQPYAGYNTGARLNDHGCQVVYGDSHASDTRQCLVGLLAGRPIDMLFIDGDHSYLGVKSDYDMYAPLVGPGGLVCFHDICDHPEMTMCKVRAFWQSLDGDREEIVTFPASWGGIGVLRVPALVAV